MSLVRVQLRKPLILQIEQWVVQKNIMCLVYGLVVQWSRMLPCHGRGHGFKSRSGRQLSRSEMITQRVGSTPTFGHSRWMS